MIHSTQRNLVSFLSKSVTLFIFLMITGFSISQAQTFKYNAPDFNGRVRKILPISGDCVLVFGYFNAEVTPPQTVWKTGIQGSSGAYSGMISRIYYPIVRTQDKFHFVANHADADYNWMNGVVLYTYDAQSNAMTDTVLPGYERVLQIDEQYVYPDTEGSTFSRLALPSLSPDTSWVGTSISNQGTIGLNVSDSLMAYTQVGQVVYNFTVVDNQSGAVLHSYTVPSILWSLSNSELLSVGDSLFIQITTKFADETRVHVLDTGGLRSELVLQGAYVDAVFLNGELFLAGDFQGYSNVISIHPQTMAVTDRNIQISGKIGGMGTTGQHLKIAGVFDMINGNSVSNYAELDVNGNLLYSPSGAWAKMSQFYHRAAYGADSVFVGINLKKRTHTVSSPVIYNAAQNSLQAFSHSLDPRVGAIEIHNGELLYRYKNQSQDIVVALELQTGNADTLLTSVGRYGVSHLRNDRVYLYESRYTGNRVIGIHRINGDTLYCDHGNEEIVLDIAPMNDSLLILCASATGMYGQEVFLRSADASSGALKHTLHSFTTDQSDETLAKVFNGLIATYGDSISFMVQVNQAMQSHLSILYSRAASINSWSQTGSFSYLHNDGESVGVTGLLVSSSGNLVLNSRYYEQYHLSKAIWLLNDSTLPLGHLQSPSFVDTVNGFFSVGAFTNGYLMLGGQPYGKSMEYNLETGGRAFAVFTNPVIQGPPLAIKERVSQTPHIENILYPNPSSGLVRVDPAFQTAQISVYSSSGQLVLEAKAAIELNLKDCPKGLYLVNAISLDGRITQQKLLIH